MSVVYIIIEVSPKERCEMQSFTIKATYEYEAEGIIAANEEEAYDIFIKNLDAYYVGPEDYSCEADFEVCEHCEVDINECECEDDE
jgi:hypothetical protein